MAWKIGINFRSTLAYVTDGADEAYCRGSALDPYPVTRGGVTFGWQSGTAYAANRDAGVDRRLAGIVYTYNNSFSSFRLDLPATGDYDLRVAAGDAAGLNNYLQFRINDTITALVTVEDADGVATGHFDDVTGVDRTTSTWPTDNVKETKTFTVAQLGMGLSYYGGDGVYATKIAHLYVERAPVALSGAIAGASTVSGTAKVARKIVGAISALSTAQGDLSAARALAGLIAAASGASGNIRILKQLAGVIAAVSSVTDAPVKVSWSLNGSIIATADVTGRVSAARKIAGAINAVSSLTGILSIVQPVDGKGAPKVVMETRIPKAVLDQARTGKFIMDTAIPKIVH